MKAQRRHELRENDLAHALGVAWDYLNNNGKQLTIAVIVVGAAIVAALFGVRSRGAALEDIWRRRSQLSYEGPEVGLESLDALAAMTKEVANERFVLTSLLEQGQQALRLAQQVSAPPDPRLNDRARNAFEQMLSQFKDRPLIVGLAHTGLATVEANAFVLDGNAAHKERFERHLAAIIDDPALNGMPLQRMALDRRNAVAATFTRTEFVYPMPEELIDEPEFSLSVPSEGAGALISPAETGEPEEEASPKESTEPSDAPSGVETGTDGSNPSGRP